jgi:hypothetical protein
VFANFIFVSQEHRVWAWVSSPKHLQGCTASIKPSFGNVLSFFAEQGTESCSMGQILCVVDSEAKGSLCKDGNKEHLPAMGSNACITLY